MVSITIICNPYSIPNPEIKLGAPDRCTWLFIGYVTPSKWMPGQYRKQARPLFYSILYNSLFSNRPTIRTILPALLNKPRSSDQATQLDQFRSALSTAAPHRPLNNGKLAHWPTTTKRDHTASSAPTFWLQKTRLAKQATNTFATPTLLARVC
jgi:hypothetical protein